MLNYTAFVWLCIQKELSKHQAWNGIIPLQVMFSACNTCLFLFLEADWMAQASQTGLGFVLGMSEGLARCKQTCEAVQDIENSSFYSCTLHLSHIHRHLKNMHSPMLGLTSGCLRSCSEKSNLFSNDLPELLICFGMPPSSSIKCCCWDTLRAIQVQQR